MYSSAEWVPLASLLYLSSCWSWKVNGRYFWFNLAFISSHVRRGSSLKAIILSTFDQYCSAYPTSFMATKQTHRSWDISYHL